MANEAFFFIDSENLDDVKEKLYGYALYQGDVESFLGDKDLFRKTVDGCFIAIQRFDDKIYISQDNIGSFGIYVYREGDYFAISNSFLLMLEKLKDERTLTLNKDYADQLILSTYTTYSCTETLVCEINELFRNTSVVIDTSARSFNVVDKPLSIESLAMDSAEGVKALDTWHAKWTSAINGLVSNGKDIRVDLSGGKDSRMDMSLFLSSGIDMSKVWVSSLTDKLHTHAEDLEIATRIADSFGFKLNQFPDLSSSRLTLEDVIDNSFYTKFGLHRQMYFRCDRYEKPLMYFSGGGGELLREFQYQSLDVLVGASRGRQKALHAKYDFSAGFRRILETAKEQLEKMYGRKLEGPEFGRVIFREANNRTHCGKAMVEAYLDNVITFMPLEDSILEQINPVSQYYDLLVALIFTRYCPHLLDFEFDSGRTLPEETLNEAKRICEQYPLQAEAEEEVEPFNFIIGVQPSYEGTSNIVAQDALDWCQKMLESHFVEDQFGRYYPGWVYSKIVESTKEEKWQSMENGYAVMAIALASYYTSCSDVRSGSDVFSAFEQASKAPQAKEYEPVYTQDMIDSCLKKLTEARIDFKLSNPKVSESNVKILSTSFDEAMISNPKWFSNKNGIGYICELSNIRKARIELECCNSGTLMVRASGPYARLDGKHLPVYIDLKTFKVNNRKLIKKTTPVTLDKRIQHKMKVKKGKRVIIEVEWSIHDWSSEKLVGLFGKMLLE